MKKNTHPSITHISTASSRDEMHGDRFAIHCRHIGKDAGSSQLGVNYFELEKDKRSFPNHWHALNEESIYIIEGNGTIQLANKKYPIEAGNYISLPVGPNHSHQMINNSKKTLKYLCISTNIPGDIIRYPDSNKICIYAGNDYSNPIIFKIIDDTANVPYWKNEKESNE